MTTTGTSRLTFLKHWQRLYRSPRFPYLLFLVLAGLGALSQVYCYWWDIQIQKMLVRNHGTAKRATMIPVWVKKQLGTRLISHLEPIVSIEINLMRSPTISARPDDLKWLRGLFFLTDLNLGLVEETSPENLRNLGWLTQLRSAKIVYASSEAVASIEKLPRLEELTVVFPSPADASVCKRIASIPRLRRLNFFTNNDHGNDPLVCEGLRELAKSPSLYRLATQAIGREQFLALTGRPTDGSPPFPDLRELKLTLWPDVTVRDLENFKSFPKLIHLDLSMSRMTDEHLTALRELPYLRTLYLEDIPSLTDAGADILASISNLQSINVKSTSISDRGLLTIAGLPRLRSLRAHASLEARAEARKRLPAGCEFDTH